jgi:7-carboxy-7-deazaguanine synthase
MSVNDVIKEVAKYSCRSVSITGGEPLLQREELLKLIQRLKKMDYWIQINTNGTIFDEEIFSLADLISMDCKCPSSKMKSDLSVLEKTTELFKKKTQFKFIISDEEDYEYAVNKVSSFLHGTSNIIFQPEWNSKKFARKLVDLVKRDNLRVKVILQQHKMIWGVKRGV